jgi:hypothetical protein
MALARGPGTKMARSPRMRNIPRENLGDETTDAEVFMAGSGRKGVVPAQGLVGAHRGRLEHRPDDQDASRLDEPVGPGADVAPTKTAEVRERVRHQLQRHEGVVPAGTEGNLRQRRPSRTDRRTLDDAARKADGVVDRAKRTRH